MKMNSVFAAQYMHTVRSRVCRIRIHAIHSLRLDTHSDYTERAFHQTIAVTSICMGSSVIATAHTTMQRIEPNTSMTNNTFGPALDFINY